MVDTPVDVQIDRNCDFAIPAQKSYIELDYFTPDPNGSYHTQAQWTITKDAGDTALLSAKSAAYQDPRDYGRGMKIKKLLNAEYYFDRGTNTLKSGKAKAKPPYKKNNAGQDEPVTWYYSLSILHADGTHCEVDPGVCYRTADGGVVCR